MHIRDYIEHLRSKPEHVRRRIALGSSIGITSVVALGWLVALTSSGPLALSASDAGSAPALSEATKETQGGFTNLLGAVSAFQSDTSGETSLRIVDERASSTLDQPHDPNEGKTVIPF